MSTKVAVIGAGGRIGQLVVQKLKEGGKYKPYAFVRREEHVELFKKQGVDVLQSNIEDVTVDQLKEELKGMAAVIFTAGAGATSDQVRMYRVEIDGVVKVKEALEAIGLKRFILLSSAKVEDRALLDTVPELRNNFISKRTADLIILKSDLDFTILRPGYFVDDLVGTRKVASLDEYLSAKGFLTIATADVAEGLVQALYQPENVIRAVVPLASGDKDIVEYFKEYKAPSSTKDL